MTGHGGDSRAVGACRGSRIAFVVREQREKPTFLLFILSEILGCVMVPRTFRMCLAQLNLPGSTLADICPEICLLRESKYDQADNED